MYVSQSHPGYFGNQIPVKPVVGAYAALHMKSPDNAILFLFFRSRVSYLFLKATL